MARASASAWATGPSTSSTGGGATTPSKARRAASGPSARVAISRSMPSLAAASPARLSMRLDEGVERRGHQLGAAPQLARAQGELADGRLVELTEDLGGALPAEAHQHGRRALGALARRLGVTMAVQRGNQPRRSLGFGCRCYPGSQQVGRPRGIGVGQLPGAGLADHRLRDHLAFDGRHLGGVTGPKRRIDLSRPWPPASAAPGRRSRSAAVPAGRRSARRSAPPGPSGRSRHPG